MKRFTVCFAFILATLTGAGQYKLVIHLKNLPELSNAGNIYLAGNFNNWNPADKSYIFSKNNDSVTYLQTVLPAGDYRFKCTRGGWPTVESMTDGGDIENRFLALSSDTVIDLQIAAWKDQFGAKPPSHTASSHVHLLDSSFFMPALERYRRIWVYLPEGYKKSMKRYPVLYMHDGQNLFDDFTAAFGEWGVDECLDSLINAGEPPCIVVGIDNGPRRMNEYNPYDSERFGEGEGDKYVDFIANTLKPYIDSSFRTHPSKENTLIAGSSMGGLISYYAVLKYPDVFGKVGIFSPAYWTAPAIRNLTDSLAGQLKAKMFFYIGGKEGERYIQDMEDVVDILGEKSVSMIYKVIDPEAMHNEKAWRSWFPEFYQWIMADGFNYQVDPF